MGNQFNTLIILKNIYCFFIILSHKKHFSKNSIFTFF